MFVTSKGCFSDTLSPNFTLRELTRTSTGLSNEPHDYTVVANLRQVAEQILEPVRKHFNQPVIIHSGYRSPAVNKAVKGSARSDHCHGRAVDFHVKGFTNYDVVCWMADNIKYHQLILENFLPNSPTSGWVHCAIFKGMDPKVQTKFKGSSIYHKGILLTAPK